MSVRRGSILSVTSTGAHRGLDNFRADIPRYTLTFGKGLSPTDLLARMGIDPDTLALRDAADLADEFGEALHSVLALAENAFGLRVTPAGDDEQRWSGSLLPLTPRDNGKAVTVPQAVTAPWSPRTGGPARLRPR